jgi:hypothetical protein
MNKEAHKQASDGANRRRAKKEASVLPVKLGSI